MSTGVVMIYLFSEISSVDIHLSSNMEKPVMVTTMEWHDTHCTCSCSIHEKKKHFRVSLLTSGFRALGPPPIPPSVWKENTKRNQPGMKQGNNYSISLQRTLLKGSH
jgi:hypothetical protein